MKTPKGGYKMRKVKFKITRRNHPHSWSILDGTCTLCGMRMKNKEYIEMLQRKIELLEEEASVLRMTLLGYDVETHWPNDY